MVLRGTSTFYDVDEPYESIRKAVILAMCKIRITTTSE